MFAVYRCAFMQCDCLECRWRGAKRAAAVTLAIGAVLAALSVVLTSYGSGSAMAFSPASAAEGAKAPASVVILIAGFGSALPASSYNPLTGEAPAAIAINKAFDPSPTSEPAGCSASPDLTVALERGGALVVPFSYDGVQISGTASLPKVVVNAYPSSAASTMLPQTAAMALATEVRQLHALWPSAHIVIVGHSEGGYVAEQYFVKIFRRSVEPEVTGIFSLDSPINGVSDENLVALLLAAIHFPASTQLLDQFQAAWKNAGVNDAAVVAKDNPSTYIPVGTAGDNVYRIADEPGPGITSQVLVGGRGQALSSHSSPNFYDPATPPLAGLTNARGVVASHQCVMGNAAVIAEIVGRLSHGPARAR
jgi:pimeloyl-ACP methyl ester carboxylesterase